MKESAGMRADNQRFTMEGCGVRLRLCEHWMNKVRDSRTLLNG